MADNVQIDEGSSGKYTATDEVTSNVHAQKIKVIDGTAASTNALVVDSSGHAAVDIHNISASSPAAVFHVDDNSGALTVDQATAANLNAAVVGAVAHDGSTASNPVTIAARSLAVGTATADVNADADVTQLLATRGGRLYVCTFHPNRFWAIVSDHNTAQTNHLLQAAPAAGLANYITDIVISNGATAGSCQILDGSGGGVLWYIYMAINGGCAIQLATPIRCTTATGTYFTSTTVTTHTVAIGGFIGA